MIFEIRQDDLSSVEVQSLIAEHLSAMQSNSPAGHAHALAIQNLQASNITFWTTWLDGVLCGCGALKERDPLTGEIKSMRTRLPFFRRGVAQAILDKIVRTAHQRGYSQLCLKRELALRLRQRIQCICAMASSGMILLVSTPPQTSTSSWPSASPRMVQSDYILDAELRIP